MRVRVKLRFRVNFRVSFRVTVRFRVWFRVKLRVRLKVRFRVRLRVRVTVSVRVKFSVRFGVRVSFWFRVWVIPRLGPTQNILPTHNIFNLNKEWLTFVRPSVNFIGTFGQLVCTCCGFLILSHSVNRSHYDK